MLRAVFCAVFLAAAVPDQPRQGLPTDQPGGITGRIVDEDNRLLPGATVEVVLATGARRAVVTNVDGVYRFDDLTPGTYQLVATMPGFFQTRRDRVAVGPTVLPQPDLRLMIHAMCECVFAPEAEKRERLRRLGVIRARITDGAGAGVAFVRVTVTRPDRSTLRLLSDWNGEVAVAAEPGAYTVKFEYAGETAVERSLEVASASVARVDLRLNVQRPGDDTGSAPRLSDDQLKLRCIC